MDQARVSITTIRSAFEWPLYSTDLGAANAWTLELASHPWIVINVTNSVVDLAAKR